MRKISFLVFLLTALSVAGCSMLGGGEEEASGAMSDAKVETPVSVEVVKTTSFTRVRSYVGNVSASKQVKVIPLASERILKYPWENGDYVEKGQVIAEIRNEVSKRALDALNAQLKSVNAQLAAGERELKRVQSMYESNIVSRQQLDQAMDGVTTLNATKQQMLATLEQSKLGLDYARVVAPIDGVISQKSSEVGDIASSAMPLCVLLDMQTLKVTLNMHEGDVPYVKLGQEVKLRFDAFPGEVVTAKITRIMPYVNTSSRTNTVEAEFANTKIEATGQYKFKPGMYSNAEVALVSTNDAIVVAPNSLLLDPELLEQQVAGQTLRRVFVLNSDSTVSARVVEVGERNGDFIQILKGLNPGDKLVTRGHHMLIDGEKVREISGPEAAADKAVAATDSANVVEGT